MLIKMWLAKWWYKKIKYLTIERNKLLICTTKINFTTIMLSEKSQLWKHVFYSITFIWNSKNRQNKARVLKIRLLFGCVGGVRYCKVHQGTFWDNRNNLYINWNADYIGIYIGQNLMKYTLKIYAYYHRKSMFQYIYILLKHF